VTRLLEPEPQQRLQPSADRPTDTHRLAEWVARQHEGNRNDGLYWAANRALEAGLTDLGELADAARRTGLEEREIARTLASAYRQVGRPSDAEPPTGRPPRPASRQREAEAS
jgi:RecB family exonuclease